MDMAAASTTSRPGPLVWLRIFLRDELSPYPGRGALVARMVVAASIVMLVNMTFKIPYGAYATLYALTTSRENPDSTLKAIKTSVLWFAIAAAYVLIGAILFSSDPVLRVVWVLVSLFLIFFSLSAAASHLAAVRFGYLVAITLTLWDSEIRAEEKVVGTLWAIGSFSFAHLIIATVEFIFVRLQPTDQIKSAIVDRLQSVASLLRSLSVGVKSDVVEQRVTRLAILGTSRMRRDLRRSDYSSETNQQEGALIALVGRLIDLGASVAVLSSQHSNEVRRWYHDFADRVDVLTDLMLGERTSLEQELPIESPPPGTTPLLLEMARTVAVAHEILSGSGLRGGYQNPPIRPGPARRFFAPDAFSNPDHVRFGIRGGLAASLCYLLYNLVAWPGISTAITTCLLTALTTVGASRQKQVLRFAGALVGGVILGFGTQMFVLPGIESISGFLILFLIVTIPAAWIASSGPRLSYFGVQIALAFYLMNLQEFKFQISLAVARDRLAGILLGLVAMWFVFDQLWEASAAVEMERTFVSTIRLLGRMMRAPTSLDPAAAIGEIDSLRESVNANFDRLRQHADGVMLELGSSRERNLTMRAQLLGWQLQLRMLFISRVALLKYRMRFPGFEVPEQILQAQRAFDIHVAERLDEMANRLTGNDVAMQRGLEPLLLPLETSIHEMCPSESPDCLPAVRSLLPLCRKVDSILSFLEEDIFSA